MSSSIQWGNVGCPRKSLHIFLLLVPIVVYYSSSNALHTRGSSLCSGRGWGKHWPLCMYLNRLLVLGPCNAALSSTSAAALVVGGHIYYLVVRAWWLATRHHGYLQCRIWQNPNPQPLPFVRGWSLRGDHTRTRDGHGTELCIHARLPIQRKCPWRIWMGRFKFFHSFKRN